jgi:hypothetical protein
MSVYQSIPARYPLTIRLPAHYVISKPHLEFVLKTMVTVNQVQATINAIAGSGEGWINL